MQNPIVHDLNEASQVQEDLLVDLNLPEILAVEHNLMQLADEMHQNQGFALHEPLANDIIMGIPLDQLVVSGEDDPQENPEESEPLAQN